MSRYGECALCEKKNLKSGESEYSNAHGTVCLDCIRSEHPDHLFIGDESRPKKDDIATLVDPAGYVTIVHVPTGIAARKTDAKSAKKLLDKILSDVRTVERNERYGNCME